MLGYERKANFKFEGVCGEKSWLVVSVEISSGAEQMKRKLKIRELRLSSTSPNPSPTSVLQPSSDLNSPHHSLRQRFKNRFL